MEEQITFMREAIRISMENVSSGKGSPFGAVIVKDGKLIAKGTNEVTSTNDPTTHAEIVAISKACHILITFQLLRDEAQFAFVKWRESADKSEY